MQLLKRITQQAADDMLLPHNPLQSLKKPKEPRREANFLTIPELNHLVSHVHPHFQTLVLIAGFLGLRQGELFGLHPTNVDLAARKITVVEQLLGNASTPTRAELKTQTSRRRLVSPPHREPRSTTRTTSLNRIRFHCAQRWADPKIELQPASLATSNESRRP